MPLDETRVYQLGTNDNPPRSAFMLVDDPAECFSENIPIGDCVCFSDLVQFEYSLTGGSPPITVFFPTVRVDPIDPSGWTRLDEVILRSASGASLVPQQVYPAVRTNLFIGGKPVYYTT